MASRHQQSGLQASDRLDLQPPDAGEGLLLRDIFVPPQELLSLCSLVTVVEGTLLDAGCFRRGGRRGDDARTVTVLSVLAAARVGCSRVPDSTAVDASHLFSFLLK